jgi:cytochrome c oxidase subunit 3
MAAERVGPRGTSAKPPPLLAVGMVLFLASELMFFGALFAMYFTLKGQASRWPPAGTNVDLLEPAVFTAILVASSFTMQQGVQRIRGSDRAGMRRWTWITTFLGVVFLAGQAHGYAKATFAISSNAYGSAFYAMTGLHALHVFAGLLLLLVVPGRARIRWTITPAWRSPPTTGTSSTWCGSRCS